MSVSTLFNSLLFPTHVYPTHSTHNQVLYGYALAYLVAPETFSSANVVELIGSLPDAVKYAGKLILAAPFAFHSLNGLRHLGWDMGRCECTSYTFRVTRGTRI